VGKFTKKGGKLESHYRTLVSFSSLLEVTGALGKVQVQRYEKTGSVGDQNSETRKTFCLIGMHCSSIIKSNTGSRSTERLH
jgi:hypothetical protein